MSDNYSDESDEKDLRALDIGALRSQNQKPEEGGKPKSESGDEYEDEKFS